MKNGLGLSQKQLLLLLGAVPFNFLLYYGGRALAAGLEHHSMAVPLDSSIPFLPWTVLIYWGCYVFWVINYYLGVRCDSGSGCRFLAAHYIGELICFCIFLLYPTTMVRADNPGSSLAGYIVSLTYQYDEANNLFPSIHCFASWLCWIAVRGKKQIPVWYRTLSLVFAVMVCISTLTVKQHVLADIPAGIAVAELSYWLASIPGRLSKRKPSPRILPDAVP